METLQRQQVMALIDDVKEKLTNKEYKDIADALHKPKPVDIEDEPSFHEDTILYNVVCNHCKNTLPPHSIKRHLDTDDKILKCPHFSD